MKSIINKATEIDIPKTDKEETRKLNYADLIKIVSDSIPQGGWTKSSMQSSIMIDGAIKDVAVDTEIHLENSDAEYLKNAVKNQKWGIKHKDILAFMDDVEKMQEVKKDFGLNQ